MIHDFEDSSDESDVEVGARHDVVKSITSTLPVSIPQTNKNPNISIETVNFDGPDPTPTSSLTLKMVANSSLSFDIDSARESVSPVLESSGGSGGGSPIPSPFHRRDPSGDSDILIVSRASQLIDEDWVKIDIAGSTIPSSLEATESFKRKQLYLLVARCIAYAFNTKHQIETSPPKQKLNADRYRQIMKMLMIILSGERHRSQDTFLTHQEQVTSRDQGFLTCLQWFVDTVGERHDVDEMCSDGRFSVKELENIFSIRAKKQLSMSSPTFSLDTSEHQLWCNTFRKAIELCSHAFPSTPMMDRDSSLPGSGTTPNPDKLYRLFQQILKIQNKEHQILFKECHLGKADEQEAVVRRELQQRRKLLEDHSSLLTEGKFGSHKLEEIYREEQLKMLKTLNDNLDRELSITASGINAGKEKKKKGGGISETGNFTVSKKSQYQLKLKATVHEISDWTLPDNKPVFIVFELVDGGGDPQFRTEAVQPKNGKAIFRAEGEFWTHSPVPQIKFHLKTVSKGFMSDDKLIAKKVHTVMPSDYDTYATLEMDKEGKEGHMVGKLRVSTILERPTNIRKCGYLTASGDHMFKQRKHRFFALIQLDQYQFLLSTFPDNASLPRENLLLDQSFFVEYPNDEDVSHIDPVAKVMFVLVSDVSEVRLRFGCRDDAERQDWIKWLMRATEQDFNPQLDEKKGLGGSDLDRYRLREVVESVKDVTKLDPHKLFVELFKATLGFRLNEDVFSRGLFSPAQMYVLDEFCARYGVRDPFRHLTCLRIWLEKEEEEGQSIWPVMLLSSFRFCQMHVGGMNPPEKSVIVTIEEKTAFIEVCQQIEKLVSRKIENFRTCFPFGCPKDDLKVTIKLFNLVSAMNRGQIGAGGEDPVVRALTHIFEKAALVNYKQIYTQLGVDDEDTPLSMAKMFDLVQYCVDFMYELHDFYWEDFNQIAQEVHMAHVFTSHINAFWSFFLVDLREAMLIENDVIKKLQMFHIVNQYFSSQPTLKLGEFHQSFLSEFAPVVEGYIDDLEATLVQDLNRSFAVETWMPVSNHCMAVDGAMKALNSFQRFLQELAWPDDFANTLDSKVTDICTSRCKDAANYTLSQLRDLLDGGAVSLSYTLPPQAFTMLNTLIFINDEVFTTEVPPDGHPTAKLKIVKGRTRGASFEDSLEKHLEEEPKPMSVEEYIETVVHQAMYATIDNLCAPLLSILNKLAKYDVGDGLLHTIKMLLPTSIPVDSYHHFVSNNLDEISKHLEPKLFNNFIVNWYELQLQQIQQWLEKRPDYSLHAAQVQASRTLTDGLHECFEQHNVPEPQLNSESYDTIQDRLRRETSRVDLSNIGRH